MKFQIARVAANQPEDGTTLLTIAHDTPVFQNTARAEQWLRKDGEGFEGDLIAIVSVSKVYIVKTPTVRKLIETPLKQIKKKKRGEKDDRD